MHKDFKRITDNLFFERKIIKVRIQRLDIYYYIFGFWRLMNKHKNQTLYNIMFNILIFSI